MDIRELAIDDWVRHEFYEMNMRVRRIDGASERISAERDGLSTQAHIDHYRIVIITPDIMEQNGFTRVEGSSRWEWYLEDDDFRVVAVGLGTSSFLQYQRYRGDDRWENIAQMSCVGVNGMQHFFVGVTFHRVQEGCMGIACLQFLYIFCDNSLVIEIKAVVLFGKFFNDICFHSVPLFFRSYLNYSPCPLSFAIFYYILI